MLKLFKSIYRFVRNGVSDAVERGITDGTVEGTERALALLGMSELDTVDLLEPVEGTSVPAIPEAPAPELPTFTRSQVHAMKRDKLEELISQQGWGIDTQQAVKELKAEVMQELGI